MGSVTEEPNGFGSDASIRPFAETSYKDTDITTKPLDGSNLSSSLQKPTLRQRISVLLRTTNTKKKRNPDFMGDDLSDTVHKKFRNTRFVIGVFVILICCLVISFWLLSSGIFESVQRIQPAVIKDIQFQHGTSLVTAHDTNYAYRFGSRELTCQEITDRVFDGLVMDTILNVMLEAISELGDPCLCAPQIGVYHQIMLVQVDGVNWWLFNPSIISLPWYSASPKEEVWVERSTLYPTLSGVDVVRHSRIRLYYKTEMCMNSNIILEEKAASCATSCIQLFEGKTVYDLQSK